MRIKIWKLQIEVGEKVRIALALLGALLLGGGVSTLILIAGEEVSRVVG